MDNHSPWSVFHLNIIARYYVNSHQSLLSIRSNHSCLLLILVQFVLAIQINILSTSKKGKLLSKDGRGIAIIDKHSVMLIRMTGK